MVGGQHEQVLVVRQPQQFGTEQLVPIQPERRFHRAAQSLGHGGIARSRVHRRKVDERKRDRSRRTHTEAFAIRTEAGAQCIVASDQLFKRRVQGLATERATQPQ